MSWQGYVDTNLVGTGKVTTAAIIGLKGGVWATSPGFNVSAEEQQAIIKGLDDPAPLQASGVYVNGKKYLTLQANPRSIYGKAAAVLIGAYASPLLPGDANKVVEGLADYLISVGY
ncbi:profilin, required for normal timing of actin polymerization in response to thermal stress [Malassezia equina]|uniref:Profilin n=1 Tax=Malassezia equina TaxID=1381935 RepID=A0AAF0EHF2_9BASI|nr:profilin, required for normal timing of actin polymerization in response to thermal stress [Malassezia equina]